MKKRMLCLFLIFAMVVPICTMTTLAADESISAESPLLESSNSVADAVPITFGYTHNGNFTEQYETWYYRINMGSSGKLSIEYSGDYAARGVYIALLDADANEICGGMTYWTYSMSVYLTSGTYYVRFYNYALTGRYTLKLDAVATGESFKESQGGSNNTLKTASSIAYGRSYKGQLALNDTEDFYKITLNQSGTLNVNLDSDIERMNCLVYDSSGNPVWEERQHSWNYDTKRNVISQDLDLTSGTYYIYIFAESKYGGGVYAGTYTLKPSFVSANETFKETQGGSDNSMEKARSISADQLYRGQLAINDSVDYYKFALSGPRTVTLNFISDLGEVDLSLYTSAGTEIWSEHAAWNDVAQTNSVVQQWELSAGTYYLVMTQYEENNTIWVGNYRFKFSAILKRDWQLEGSAWYYYDNGVKVTGWQEIGGTWYYFDHSGVMQADWQLIDGDWYYLGGSGAMQTGWMQAGSTWYYFSGSGAMQTGWQEIGGTWYYFDGSGAMATDWMRVKGTWYYFDGSGAMQTGWQQIGGTWYYFSGSGAMATEWQQIDGTWYYFDDNGAMQTGFIWPARADGTGDDLYCLDSNGAMQTGWQSRYGTGIDLADGTFPEKEQWYYFGSDGAAQFGWIYDGGNWYYCPAQFYNMQTGWIQIGGSWYYFNSSGVWVG